MKPYCQAQYNNIIGRLTSNNGYFTTEIKKIFRFLLNIPRVDNHSSFYFQRLLQLHIHYVEYSAMCNCASWEVQTGLGMVSFWSLDINLSYFGGFSLGCIFCQKLELNTRNKQCPSFGFCTLDRTSQKGTKLERKHQVIKVTILFQFVLPGTHSCTFHNILHSKCALVVREVQTRLFTSLSPKPFRFEGHIVFFVLF